MKRFVVFLWAAGSAVRLPAFLLLAAALLSMVPRPAAAGSEQVRPYGEDSPWNLRIGLNPEYEPLGPHYLEAFRGELGMDPTRYTIPVYEAEQGENREIRITGVFSDVTRGGEFLETIRGVTLHVPLGPEAVPAEGRDGQLVVWDPATGEEWGVWRLMKQFDGQWTARNGYHYNTRWSGVPPVGFLSRGAGVPYLAGLVRPWEIACGRIEHALAVGVNDPGMVYVFPATKSDGTSMTGIPEGARLQLDPALTEADFDRWGLDRAGKIVARALQEYGAVVVDVSGHPKLYAEYEGTAKWGGTIRNDLLEAIPYSAFRVLSLTAPHHPDAPGGVAVGREGERAMVTWEPVPHATRYRVFRRTPGGALASIGAPVAEPRFMDPEVRPLDRYEYAVRAVNHNGVGPLSGVVALPAAP